MSPAWLHSRLLGVTTQDDEVAATFASPPCLLHEVDPAYSGLATLSTARGACAAH
jgi:hypothetical protein